MKLEYKILWIENEEDYLDIMIPQVETILIDKGFEPTIIKVVDESQIDTSWKKDYDLIISDFQLNDDENGKNGAEIIYELRKVRESSTEILFYSDRPNLLENDDVKNKLAFMERINIQQGRKELSDKIEKVINLTLKKLLELNATRGLITATTSELDVEIEDLVIMLIYDKLKLSDEDTNKIIDFYVEDFLKKSPEHFLKKYNEHGFKKWFHKIEANRKWRILRDLLSKIDTGEVKIFLESNKTYQDQVINIRNKFAHAKEVKDEKGQPILKGQFGKEDFEYTEDSCVEIRKNLIAHRRNIENLKQALNNR